MSSDELRAIKIEKFEITSQIRALERALALQEYRLYLDQKNAISPKKKTPEEEEELRVDAAAAAIQVGRIKDELKPLIEKVAAIEEKIITVFKAVVRECFESDSE